MKLLLSSFVLILFLNAKAQPDSTLVKECFNKYKVAILNDKGSDALAVLDIKTIAYYHDLLDKIKKHDSLKLDKETPVDKLTILMIRHKASKEEILKMTGESLFVYAINNGMVGKNSVSNNSVGKLNVEGDFATGIMLMNGQPTPLNYHFYKEGGSWKFNLTSILPAGNMAFKKIIEDSGKTENEAMIWMLELVSGKKPEASVWLPVDSNK